MASIRPASQFGVAQHAKDNMCYVFLLAPLPRETFLTLDWIIEIFMSVHKANMVDEEG
jgi:hypothetical protein